MPAVETAALSSGLRDARRPWMEAPCSEDFPLSTENDVTDLDWLLNLGESLDTPRNIAAINR